MRTVWYSVAIPILLVSSPKCDESILRRSPTSVLLFECCLTDPDPLPASSTLFRCCSSAVSYCYCEQRGIAKNHAPVDELLQANVLYFSYPASPQRRATGAQQVCLSTAWQPGPGEFATQPWTRLATTVGHHQVKVSCERHHPR